MTPHLITTTLDLPYPVSTNKLWRYGKGSVYSSPEYKAWKAEADALVLSQKLRAKTITEPFEATIYLNTEGGGIDVDNVKCLMDFCQRIELIRNDKLCNRFVVERTTAERAPTGCRVHLRELGV